MTHHWRYGRLSGYPICCVIYFYIRLCFVKLVGLKLIRKLERDFIKGRQHVICPIHWCLWLVGFPPKYSTCSECGWHQLGRPPCRIKSLHKTWVVAEIKEHYLNQMKDTGSIRIKQPGKIAKRIAKLVTKGSIRRTPGYRLHSITSYKL